MHRRIQAPAGLAALLTVVCCLAVAPAASGATSPGPELTVPRAELDAALTCVGPPVSGATRDPVLLFPAFSTDRESYGSNYLADLPARGIPTCSISLQDFGFGDLQRAAEFGVYAIRTVAERSGRQVAVLGHQHGAINWLQALRYWPDIAPRVSEYISLATPHRGTQSARDYCDVMNGCPPAVWQIAAGSGLLTGLTSVQAPPGPDYTSIATTFDEVITPAPAASRMAGARNIVLQDICPGRPVEHFTILTDDLARRLSFDALDNPGPADPARLADPCAGSAGPGGSGGDALGFPGRFVAAFATQATPAEPPLRCYVAGTCPVSALPPIPDASNLRLTRRCVGDGRLRLRLVGDGVDGVRDVNFKFDKRLVARDETGTFEQTASRRVLERTRATSLRAVVYPRALPPSERVILRRSLPRCGLRR